MTGTDTHSGDDVADAEQAKREALELLIRAVLAWDGREPLGRERENHLLGLSDRLQGFALSPVEELWLEISNVWLRRAARDPDAWLRRVWLSSLAPWRLYIYESRDATLPGLASPVDRGT